ncbi:uncharacterized protein BT62DRAFT_553315 [Guyanagaster necrorhizus]|uniref:Glutathione S-transferase UstS-like C-terminal domain-containing protein n=1 Tax=Guyanagaster necrorhizus TaxID=856835 RepID=A0A9P7VHK4_9AGAR|nr:uncharacterized protein BT62DRAFT_553315 [Guyanagaster necrorhizus MCA 3950]KAG7441181.1 hypothetical protein BT62DRAFT_553315 [Guyanagaster necrorhizus MCA 3950]
MVYLPSTASQSSRMTTGAVVSDSPAIAYLDKTYPSSGPVLITARTKTLQLAFLSAVIDSFAPFRPFYAVGIVTEMNEAIAVYFLKTRLGGAAKAEITNGEEREKLWGKAKENLGKMSRWFEGDFIMGSEPCFATTAICAYSLFMRRMVGEESEEWKDIIGGEGIWMVSNYMRSCCRKGRRKRKTRSGKGRRRYSLTSTCTIDLVPVPTPTPLTLYLQSWLYSPFHTFAPKSAWP